jgi:integrase
MPFFGDEYLSEITLAMAEQYKAQRFAIVDPATVNKELNCLKAMLNKAAAWKHLKTHPLVGMKLPKEPPGRLRYLTLAEKDRLLEACADPLYRRPIVELAIHTGMRRGNIVKLRWADIDLKRRIILLPKTKTIEFCVSNGAIARPCPLTFILSPTGERAG